MNQFLTLRLHSYTRINHAIWSDITAFISPLAHIMKPPQNASGISFIKDRSHFSGQTTNAFGISSRIIIEMLHGAKEHIRSIYQTTGFGSSRNNIIHTAT